MDFSLFFQKDIFPQYIADKLDPIVLDYKDKHKMITNIPNQLAAGVVLLINFRSNPESC